MAKASKKKAAKKTSGKKAAKKKVVAKKSAPKKTAPKGKGATPLLFSKSKPWAVDCGTHGHLGDFATEPEADNKKKAHLAEKGNEDDDVRVTGPQSEIAAIRPLKTLT